MSKRRLNFTKGWEWLRTEDCCFVRPKREESDAVAPRSSRQSAGVLVAGAAVVFGLVGLLRWQQQQNKPAAAPKVVYVETPAEPVRSVAVRVPRSAEGIQRIFDSARAWMEHLHSFSDEKIAVLVWSECWRGVEFPGRPQPDDHPSVAQAHTLVQAALVTARRQVEAERAAKGDPVFEDAPRGATVLDMDVVDDDVPVFAPGELDFGDDVQVAEASVNEPARPQAEPDVDRKTELIACMTHERPTPGYFFRIDDDTAEDGVEGLASLAVLSGLLEAARAKGWSAERTMKRASQVAESMECVIDYAALIRQSEWNAGRIEPLRSGTTVWLPPIKPAGLLNLRKPPQVSLDQQPWTDGSSRLEPPPEVRPRWGAAERAADLPVSARMTTDQACLAVGRAVATV